MKMESLFKSLKTLTLGVCLTFASISASAGPGFDGSYLTEYKGGVNTPHKKLAKPYASGKPKVLFILGRDQSQGQEVKEIEQRADLNLDVFFFAKPQEIGGAGIYYSQAMGVTPPEKEHSLIEKLSKSWDVIVIGSVEFDAFPASCKFLFLEHFWRGGGVVVMRYPKDYKMLEDGEKPDERGVKFITKGIPFEGLYAWNTGWFNYMTGNGNRPYKHPETKKIYPKSATFELSMIDGAIKCFSNGKSRYVSINDWIARRYWERHSCLFYDDMSNDLKSYLSLRKELDIHCGLLIRAIYWAAHMVPQATIEGIPEKTLKVEAGKPFTLPLEFAYGKKAPISGYNLRWELIDVLGRKYSEGNVALVQKPKKAEIKLPALCGTGFFLNIWLENNKKVEDWGHFHIMAKASIDFGPIILRKEYFQKNAEITGTLKAPVDSKIRLFLVDRWNRDISSGVFSSEKEIVEFSLPLNGTKSMLVAVVADLLGENGKVVARKIKETYVEQMREDDFLVAMWPSTQNMDISFFTNRNTLTNALGVTAEVDTPETNLPLVNMNGVWRQHWVGRYFKDVNAPEQLEKNIDLVKKSAAEARKLSRRTHLLGDEVKVESAMTKNSLTPWRKWLEKDYKGDVSILNAEWNTDYKSFDDIPVFSAKEIEKLKKDKFPVYVDIKRYSQINTGDFIGKVKKITEKSSQQTFTGLQYLRLFNNDAEYFANSMNCVSSPTPLDPTLKLFRDMADKNSLNGGWTGGYFNQRDQYRRLIWHNLIIGCNSLWLFIESGSEGLVACDGRISEHIKWVVPDYQAMINGLGRFVLEARRLNSSVAILHDYRNVVCAEGVPGISDYEAAHRIFDKILNDAGIQYHYIGGREVENSILKKEKFKTLILPFTTSITKKQAKEIQSFVESGGTLVCDVATGIFDGHGKTVRDGIIADVLGVEQNFDGKIEKGKPKSSIGIELPFAITLPLAKATTAKAFGSVANVPGFFKNEYGKGTSWLLNFSPLVYGDLAEVNKEGKCAEAFGEIMGVKPLVKFVDKSGNNLAGLDVFNVFDLDGRRMLAVMFTKNIPLTEKPKIILDKKWHIYNTLTGKSLGFTDTIDLQSVKKFEPYIFSLNPFEIKGILAKFEKKPSRGEITTISISLEGGVHKGKDVIHVELKGPSGQRLPWGTGNYILHDGKGEIKLPVAENEKPGEYLLTITDVLTRLSAKKEYTLPEVKR